MDEQNISVCVTDLSVRIGEQFAQFANMAQWPSCAGKLFGKLIFTTHIKLPVSSYETLQLDILCVFASSDFPITTITDEEVAEVTMTNYWLISPDRTIQCSK